MSVASEAELYRRLFETSSEGMLVHGPEGEILEINASCAAIAGYTREEFLQLEPRQYVHPDSVSSFMEYLECLRAGRSYEAEVKGFDKQGEIVHLGIRGVPFQHQGEPRMLCLCHDLTVERRLEEALRQGEAFYRTIFESSSVGLLIMDRDMVAVDANPAFSSMFGYTLEEMRTTDTRALVPPETMPLYEECRRRTAEGETFEAEASALRRDGSTFLVEARVSVVEYQGTPHLLAIVQDVTERRRASEALEQSEALYRAVFDNTTDGLFLADLDYRFVDANPAAWEMHGLTREELLGLGPLDLIHPEDRRHFQAFRQAMERGENFTGQGRHVAPDGRVFPVEVHASPIELHGAPHVMVSIRDMTRRQRLQAELRHAQKMEAVGRLAGGIAHDFNNLLNSIMGFGSLLEMELSDRAEQAEHARTIVSVARRAADLTGQLLAFSRRGPTRNESLDLHALIRETVQLLGQTIDPRIELRAEVGETALYVAGDPGHLQSVFLNLGINAGDAIRDRGKVVFRTELVEADEELVRVHSTLEGGQKYVLATVTDDGMGVAPEALEHLFEPFFTTKESGKGTGLGLAAVYGIVTDHGGAVSVESEPGQGATFRVILPVADEGGRTGAVASELSLVTGEGRILVVDDEEMIRRMAKLLLEKLGYTVHTASDGIDGLEVFQREEVDLIILDLAMPRMGGKEALREIRKRDPEVPVLVCSGYHFAEDGAGGDLSLATDFLPKPFDARTLSRKLAELLAARGAPG